MSTKKQQREEQKKAREVAKLRASLDGPPPVAAVATHPDSMEEWRVKVAETGMPVAMIPDETLQVGRGRLCYGHTPVAEGAEPDESPPGPRTSPDGPLRVIIHRPENPQSVRVETGPEGTEIHLGE